MSATTVDVVAELEQRAGASDKDREQWLAERRRGVTATEIRELMLGNITDEELADRKLGRIRDDFAGNAYTAWGNEREPVIAAIVEQRWAIRPESRVFRAADNPRHLASPDGLGVDFDETLRASEIKTGAERFDLAPWGHDFEKKGYGLQIQWNHHVLGAERTLYSWEQRLGMPGSFRPGLLRHEWVERDDKVIARLVERADRFLAVLDARAAEEPAGPAPIDEELDTLAVNYLRGLDLEKEAKALKEPAYRAMFERLDAGEPVLQESPLARVSFTPAIVEVRPVFAVSEERARAAARAGLYERLEQAENDVEQAQAALERERLAVAAHEAEFIEQTGTESVVLKKASLRVAPAKETKETK